ncbi:MAG: pro-sigmaK processing inhibitor BofA [Ruminococcaceae bacterium]|nr:pro-sigmaK processing inhibitor BofA [Oscillospiraceae bacterium]
MESILALLIPALLAILVIKLFLSQVKLIWKIAINSASGFACLWLLNLASGITGFVFEINFVTALLVGFLGIPGILLLVLGQFMA